MTQRIEKSFFTTRGLQPEQRPQAWSDSIGTLFDVSAPALAPDADFNASVTSYLLNRQIMLGLCECSAQRFERSPLRVARDGLDYYLIQTHVAGSQDVYRGNKQLRAGVGDLMVIDLADRHRAVTTDFANLTLVVPRQLLAPFLLQPDSQEGRVLKRNGVLTELAVHHLTLLYGSADRLTPTESLQLIEPTLMLLASALNGSTETVEKGATSVALSLLGRARQEIERRLSQDLPVEELCLSLRVSRTALYRLFEPLGGVRAYIQERRLRRCAEALVSRRHMGRKIFEIANDCGFRSEAHFSRAFKQHYGMTPSEARKASMTLALLNNAPTDEPVGDRYYEQWLRETLRT